MKPIAEGPVLHRLLLPCNICQVMVQTEMWLKMWCKRDNRAFGNCLRLAHQIGNFRCSKHGQYDVIGRNEVCTAWTKKPG